MIIDDSKSHLGSIQSEGDLEASPQQNVKEPKTATIKMQKSLS